MTTITASGKRHTGKLLYLYTYPHRVRDEDGRVVDVEQRPQRAGLLLPDGSNIHFTVHFKVSP